MEEQMEINYFSPFTVGGAWNRMKNVNTPNSAFKLVTKKKVKKVLQEAKTGSV